MIRPTPALALLVLLPPALAVADPGDWREREHLTGEWGGLREMLRDAGIEPFADYTAGVWGNVRGGGSQGSRYEGFTHWGLDVDLARLLGWKGARIHTSWHSVHGGPPSSDLVGTSATHRVSGFEGRDSLRLFHLFLAQELFDGALLLEIGKLAADDHLAVSHHGAVLRNAAFGDFVRGEDPLAGPVYPLTAPGIYAEARPPGTWVGRLGAYTADAGRDRWSNLGFEASFDDGVALFGELALSERPLARPGTYTLGVAAVTGQVPDLGDAGHEQGALVLYAMLDQRAGTECVLELSYRAALTPWLDLQPELQIVLAPRDAGRDAVVLGLQLSVRL